MHLWWAELALLPDAHPVAVLLPQQDREKIGKDKEKEVSHQLPPQEKQARIICQETQTKVKQSTLHFTFFPGLPSLLIPFPLTPLPSPHQAV